MGFISPPTKINPLLRLGLWVARRVSGVDLCPARLLTWYPKAAVSSAMLEGLITHSEGRMNERLLKLVRLAVSFAAACPFCIDLNSAGWEKLITLDEIAALRGKAGLEDVPSFLPYERLAIQYARLVSATPLNFSSSFLVELKGQFSEREIVILATTAAQVNYWTRLIQALGCPPAGVSGSDVYLG